MEKEKTMKYMPLGEAVRVGLPKWPQCLVQGRSVEPGQALEIIRRTDKFFRGWMWGGNDKEFDDAYRERLGMPPDPAGRRPEDVFRAFDALGWWQEKWGYIPLEWLGTEWVSSSWIGGPTGWIHPDGHIAYCNNIGKWPDASDVAADLGVLGREFPFLEMTATLMSGEEGEPSAEPLATLELSGGRVRAYGTPLRLEENAAAIAGGVSVWTDPDAFFAGQAKTRRVIPGSRFPGEHGLEMPVLDKWAEDFAKTLECAGHGKEG